MDLSKFTKLPLFRNKDIKLHYGIKYPEIYICRNIKKIKTIEKGKYTIYEDPLIYATQIINPSYLSFLSALNFYGYTTQMPLKLTVAITKQKKELDQIKFIKINKKCFFGYQKIKYGDFEIFVAEKEKLLLDCLLYQKYVSISELKKLITDNLDKDKIINYLNRINNNNLIRRVGYILEKHEISIYEEYEKRIKKIKKYVLLNRNLKNSKTNNSRWKINVNEEINYDNY
jgi:predicted transcriptional regulator of viral defense system